MKVILVTGGGGYVGSHACRQLRARGWTPVTFDNFATGWRDAVRFGPLVEGDLLEPDAVDKLVFSSTAAVYGETDDPLIGEDAPTRPTNA